MMGKLDRIVDKLITQHYLNHEEFVALISERTPLIAGRLQEAAQAQLLESYGNRIFIRGLIEISNYCQQNCLYCGIRHDNKDVVRYRLSETDIYSSAEKGYQIGFRTFVLQGGEDGWFNDERLVRIIKTLKEHYPDCAITLSLGERSQTSYQKLFDAGADRYLLRHESANPAHFARLHPKSQTLASRLKCLEELKSIGYQVGCGFMVGSPYQQDEDIALDLELIEHFKPQMVGIGPFISQHDTPFKDMPNGDEDLTLFLLSIVRLLLPNVLLPATTALATVDESARIKGIQAGCNVIMPNLSPLDHRKDYALYDNKKIDSGEAGENLNRLKASIQSIGYQIVVDRGDYQKEGTKNV